MDAEKTDKLIARAIAALPYNRPSTGFSARVMAAIAPVSAPCSWSVRVLEAVDLIVTTWAAALTFVAARLVYGNLADIAALFIQPGGFSRAFNFLIARAALVFAKLAAAMSFIGDLMSVAVSGLPAWYEVAAAALICSVAIAALSKSGRVSSRKAGI